MKQKYRLFSNRYYFHPNLQVLMFVYCHATAALFKLF